MTTYTMTGPSVQTIAAGVHAEGVEVTVTGFACYPVEQQTRRGDKWATFDLVEGGVAVEMRVYPKVYANDGAQLNWVVIPGFGGRPHPSRVRVTGTVGWRERRPVLVAQQVTLLSDGEPVPEDGDA